MLDVLLVTKKLPSPEILQLKSVLSQMLEEKGGNIKIKSVSSDMLESNSISAQDFNIYIGYDFNILSHFFASVNKSHESFFIFYSPAGEGPENSLNYLIRDCVDYMDCPAEVYKKVVGVWSYKEIISYIAQRQAATTPRKSRSTKATSEAAPRVAAGSAS